VARLSLRGGIPSPLRSCLHRRGATIGTRAGWLRGCKHWRLNHVRSSPAIQIARRAEPADRVLERLTASPRLEPEIASGLSGGEKHAVLGHSDSVQSHERFASTESRRGLRKVGERNSGGAGNAQARRAPADETRDLGKHVGQLYILAPEDVAFADDA